MNITAHILTLGLKSLRTAMIMTGFCVRFVANARAVSRNHLCGITGKNTEIQSCHLFGWLWTVEVLAFKEVSFLFSHLRHKDDKQEIADFWNLDHVPVVQSWFRSIV